MEWPVTDLTPYMAAIKSEQWRIYLASVTPRNLVGEVILAVDRKRKMGLSEAEACEAVYHEVASGLIR